MSVKNSKHFVLKGKKKVFRLTSWRAPFLVPFIPLDITSAVEVLAIIQGNISDHRFCNSRK